MSGTSLNNAAVQPCPRPTTGYLNVIVKNAINGRLLEGATVEITGSERRESTTDMHGTAYFSDVTVGIYSITAYKEPLTTSSENYVTGYSGTSVAPTITSLVEIMLKPVTIAAVEFLDGDPPTELSATGKQFVNLPRERKWVDGTHVLNIERLSYKPLARVRFDGPGSYNFKIKLVPGSNNVVYTAGEKGRNNNFNSQESEKLYTTDGDGTKIIPPGDFFVAVAGKDTYKLVAKDDYGNEVESHSIETHRLVYYKEIKMRGMTAAAPSLSTFESEFAKHNITLVSFGSVEMDHMPNISTNDEETFKTKARTAYSGSDAPTKEPYVVAIAYTNHLAVKNPNREVEKRGVQVGPGKPDVDILINGPGLRPGDGFNDRYLWKNIVPGESWFISAKFLKDGGSPGTDDIEILEANCTPVPEGTLIPDRCKIVKVKVSGLPAATGTITLEVNWVDRFRAGLSFTGGNLICVCTRCAWEEFTIDEQNEVMIHEMGHKIGMVPDGTGTGPDQTATQYSNKGHNGSHCYEPLATNLASYYGIPNSACVMFGETNGKTAFCNNCSPAVRKQDLSGGWGAF